MSLALKVHIVRETEMGLSNLVIGGSPGLDTFFTQAQVIALPRCSVKSLYKRNGQLQYVRVSRSATTQYMQCSTPLHTHVYCTHMKWSINSNTQPSMVCTQCTRSCWLASEAAPTTGEVVMCTHMDAGSYRSLVNTVEVT